MYNKELQVTSNTKHGMSKGNDTAAASSTRSEHPGEEQTNASSQRDSQGPGTGSDPTSSSTFLSHAAGLSPASVALMGPLRAQLLQKALTPKGESQTARPLQRSLQRERDGKRCSHSFNSFRGHFASRRFP